VDCGWCLVVFVDLVGVLVCFVICFFVWFEVGFGCFYFLCLCDVFRVMG